MAKEWHYLWGGEWEQDWGLSDSSELEEMKKVIFILERDCVGLKNKPTHIPPVKIITGNNHELQIRKKETVKGKNKNR